MGRTFSWVVAAILVSRSVVLGDFALTPALDAGFEIVQMVSNNNISAPSYKPINASSSLNGIGRAIPLAEYLNGTKIPSRTVLQNVTYRFIGPGLSEANSSFMQALQSAPLLVSGQELSPWVQFEIQVRRAVEAPIYGPDGLNGTRAAYAPAPVLSDGAPTPSQGGRKMLQAVAPAPSPSGGGGSGGGGGAASGGAFNDRYYNFMGIDVEILMIGNETGAVLDITSPGQMNGYLSISMQQQNIQAQCLPINMTVGYALSPLVPSLPLTTKYVLGTVIQFKGSGMFPANTAAQSMALTALNGIYGSQPSFLYNRIQAVWQDSAEGIIRLAVLTYTTRNVSNLNELAGGDVASLMTQVAINTGANFTVSIISSRPLGSSTKELTGDRSYLLDLTVATPSNSTAGGGGGGLSAGAIAGIAVGAAAAVAIVLALAALIFTLGKRRGRNGPSKGGRDQSSLERGLTEYSDSNTNSSMSSMGGNAASTSSPKMSHTDTGGSSPRHPLTEAWHINPQELTIMKRSDGSNWILGSGSFGEVLRGLRGGVQDVAIKRLKSNDINPRMLEKEIELLRHLNYDRNLVQFYGACLTDTSLNLVLEYMGGGDLRDAIQDDTSNSLGWYQNGRNILCDIAKGLHFLHSKRVAHRDLKAKNVFLGKTGEAKIGDVGLAKFMGSQLMSTQLETAGTFAYAAPELLMNESCGTPADLYSFGVIMWEVITHETPVRGNMRPINVPEEASAEAAVVLKSCMAKNPNDRPSARAVFDFLNESSGKQSGIDTPEPREYDGYSGSTPTIWEDEVSQGSSEPERFSGSMPSEVVIEEPDESASGLASRQTATNRPFSEGDPTDADAMSSLGTSNMLTADASVSGLSRRTDSGGTYKLESESNLSSPKSYMTPASHFT